MDDKNAHRLEIAMAKIDGKLEDISHKLSYVSSQGRKSRDFIISAVVVAALSLASVMVALVKVWGGG